MAKIRQTETAESMGRKQRDIAVSEFFLKNRHLLGFDSPRKALLTTVKEAVDNSLDACEDAEILPEISVEIEQTAATRFIVSITDNGPGIVRAQIPRVFAKLLYGSKFHRLRMSRGQQGIGISAAGMYGQLTTGTPTHIRSKTASSKVAHEIDVQIDTRRNTPNIVSDKEVDWLPTFPGIGEGAHEVSHKHGTRVSIEMEAAYVRGRLSVDEYLKQCAVVNPHLQLHYRVVLKEKEKGGAAADESDKADATDSPDTTATSPGTAWTSFTRAVTALPVLPREIKPHPHGVELGMLIQMLKDTEARTLRSMLSEDFSRVSSAVALAICESAGLSPKAHPSRIAQREAETLFKAINDAKLMRPPTDCLSPIGEEHMIAGLKKEVAADFYAAVTRAPTVYRGNPFQVEAAVAYARPTPENQLAADDPVRVLRFANRVPLLHMSGACASTKAVTGVNWKTYGLAQPKGAIPVGPMVLMVHIASVWVPFTSESKEAIAHYPEIIRELTFCLQECGRQLSVFIRRRQRDAELDRKKNYMTLYIPHLALGLKDILDLSDKEEKSVVDTLHKMLERTHLETT